MYGHIPILKLFAVIFAFFFISIQIKQLIGVLYTVLTAKFFCMKCETVSLFGLLLTKHDDKWEYTPGKPSALCNVNIKVDIDQVKEKSAKELERKEKLFSIIQRCILVAVSVLLVFLFRGFMIKGLTLKGSILEVFAAYLAFGMCFHTLSSIIIYIYTYQVAMKKLGGYSQSFINRLRNGESFESFNMKPLSQLEFPNATKWEKGLYNTLYAEYLLATDNIDELYTVAGELTQLNMDSEYMLQLTPAYYFLIFWYSRYDLNTQLAKHFLDKCITTISADKDANGKRVLAYYAFGIEQDFLKARKYLNEAFGVIDKFSVGAERDLEKKLLWELDKFLKEKGY